MKVEVRTTKTFRKTAKLLVKKYPSFLDDLANLEKDLLTTPMLGKSLGRNVYKIRMKIASKRRGKSGGARVISFIETELIATVESLEEQLTVNLLSVYDKSTKETISDFEIDFLIANLEF
jgi:mRNA-degrading endonuclease RelE of RelBE toxin-antitoxin system